MVILQRIEIDDDNSDNRSYEWEVQYNIEDPEVDSNFGRTAIIRTAHSDSATAKDALYNELISIRDRSDTLATILGEI